MNQIYESSYYDELTRLPNLTQFIILAQKLMDSSAMRRQNIAFVYFNIENFKNYNQKYGLAAGDALLQTVSQLIQSSFQGRVVAHVDVDHFVVVAETADLEQKIGDLWEDIQSFKRDADIELKAGIYILDNTTKSANMALDRAKMACDEIRGKFKLKIGYYDPEAEEQKKRERQIVDSFGPDIEKGNIFPHFQPLIRTMTREICGFEALVRWNSPALGFMYPDEFIPVLEKQGLITSLDLHMVAMVCKSIRYCRDKGMTPVPISLNFSAHDFKDSGLLARVDGILLKYRIPKELIHIEITESAFADEYIYMRKAVNEFRNAGYQIWMDDFGSGYSTFNSLKDYHFDCLKIDMKFLKSYTEKPRSKTIISSIVSMAKSLHLHTVAEGVETEESYKFLQSIGCEVVQGYLFEHPNPLEYFMDSKFMYEKSDQRLYQNTIGQIDLLAANPLGNDDYEHTFRNGMALAIFEEENGHIHYLSVNSNYEDFLKKTSGETILESEVFVNKEKGKIPNLLRNVMHKCYMNGGTETIDYVINGVYCSCSVRMIASTPNKKAYLAAAFNLSEFTKEKQNSDLERSLRFIYSSYNRVDLLSDDGLVAENIYLNSTMYRDSFVNGSTRKSIHNFARNNIAPIDRERFEEFYSVDTLRDRIEKTSREHITEYFRTLDLEGNQVWQEYQIILMKDEGKVMYLSCVCDADIDRIRMLQGMDDILQDMPQEPAFLWLSSRAFSQILGYGSYKKFMEHSLYVTGNITQDTIIDYHIATEDKADASIFKHSGSFSELVGNLISKTVVEEYRRNAADFSSKKHVVQEFEKGIMHGDFELKRYVGKQQRWFHIAYQIMRQQDTGELIVYVLIFDVDDYREKADAIIKRADTDALTGALNRFAAIPLINEYISSNPKGKGALMIVDLDDFKKVNDVYGHLSGDAIIREASEKLHRYFGSFGVVFRLGGDEFVAFVEDKDNAFIKDRLTSFMNHELSTSAEGKNVKCGLSIGYAMYPRDGKNYHDLLKAADTALYSAKRVKGVFKRYSSTDQSMEPLESQNDALTPENIALANAPAPYVIVDFNTKKFLGFNKYFLDLMDAEDEEALTQSLGYNFQNVFNPEEQIRSTEDLWMELRRAHDERVCFPTRVITAKDKLKNVIITGHVVYDREKGERVHLMFFEDFLGKA